MGAMASQITSLAIVYSSVYSDQRKHQSSASLAFARGIHRWPMSSPHKGPVTRKMFPFDDVIMYYVSICSRIHPAARTRGWPMGFFLWNEDSTFLIADLRGKSYRLDHVITEAVPVPRQLWFISPLSEWGNWSPINIRGNCAEGTANSPIAMDRIDPKKYARGPRFVVFVVLVTIVMPLVMAVYMSQARYCWS